MRIKGFAFLVNEHLQTYTLNNSELVIDGQSLFYNLYKLSGAQFVLGSESDRFADFLREYLQMFKKANVTCYVIMKGGHNTEKSFATHYKSQWRLDGKAFALDKDYKGEIIQPCLAKDIFLEVLSEMDFDFTFSSTNNVVEECIALAKKFSCPVLSYNIQYCFYGVRYIPLAPGTRFNCDKDNNFTCGIFSLDKFMENYNIYYEKIILFILLTDTNIFPENFFLAFLKDTVNIKTLSCIKNYKCLLHWLSRTSIPEAINKIFRHMSKNNQEKFHTKEQLLKDKYLKPIKDDRCLSVLYHVKRDEVLIKESDPLWFQKGITLKHIAIPYINLYVWHTVEASNLIEDYKQPNSIMLTIDIIKYAYDLLKNFKGKEISIKKRDEDHTSQLRHFHLERDAIVMCAKSIKKPEYSAKDSVFENGWENIDSQLLFKHFFLETFQSFNFEVLERAQEDSRLLLIALVYFARKKEDDVSFEVLAIMLSYVMLGVVAEKVDKQKKMTEVDKSFCPLLDPITDKTLVSVQDCEIAKAILEEYFTVRKRELCNIFEREKIHPLLEFERCLQEINYLNRLCGSPYAPTVYSKTYNGTFVYKLVYTSEDDDGLALIKRMLNPASTVLAFFLGMTEIYEEIMLDLPFEPES